MPKRTTDCRRTVHLNSILSSSIRADLTSSSVRAPVIILCFLAWTCCSLSSTVSCQIVFCDIVQSQQLRGDKKLAILFHPIAPKGVEGNGGPYGWGWAGQIVCRSMVPDDLILVNSMLQKSLSFLVGNMQNEAWISHRTQSEALKQPRTWHARNSQQVKNLRNMWCRAEFSTYY